MKRNELRINISKTKFMAIGKKDYEGGVKLQGSIIPWCPEVKYLGVVVDQKLTWQSHVHSLRKKALAMISTISRVKSCLLVRVRQPLYKTLVLPQLDYCSAVWHTNCNALSTKIERLQNYAMRIILDEPQRTPSVALRVKLGGTSLHRRCLTSLLCTLHRCVLRHAPEELINLFKIELYTLLLEEKTNYIFRDPLQINADYLLHFRVLYTTIYSPRELEEHLVLPHLNWH